MGRSPRSLRPLGAYCVLTHRSEWKANSRNWTRASTWSSLRPSGEGDELVTERLQPVGGRRQPIIAGRKLGGASGEPVELAALGCRTQELAGQLRPPRLLVERVAR